MTEKELRRLSRREMLELLIEQGKKVNQLQAQLDAANARLESRQILLASAGSIAEAALKLNHIFEDAQAAADQYLENIKAQHADFLSDSLIHTKTKPIAPSSYGTENQWENPFDEIIRDSRQGGEG